MPMPLKDIPLGTRFGFLIGDATKEGNPRHPLYLPYSSVLRPF